MITGEKSLKALKVCEFTTYETSQKAFLRVKFEVLDRSNEYVTGLGQFGGKDVDMTVELFKRRFVPALLHKTIRTPFELSDIVCKFELNYKMMGVQFSKALCAVDTATWDAIAKANGVSVTELLSSRKATAINVYASSINRGISCAELTQELLRLKKVHGISAFKIKMGQRMSEEEFIRNEDLKIISRIKSSLKDSRVSVDCNGAYKDKQSINLLLSKQLVEKIWFIEEPFPWYKYEKYRSLVSEKDHSILVAGGEQEFRRDKWRDIANLFDILQPDIGYSGGFSELLLLSRQHGNILPHSPV